MDLGVASPFADSHLAKVTWSNLMGADVPTPVVRRDAMAIPPLAKGRNIICGNLDNNIEFGLRRKSVTRANAANRGYALAQQIDRMFGRLIDVTRKPFDIRP